MTHPQQIPTLQGYAARIWVLVDALDEKPIYPAIVQQMLITHKEAEYFDHDLAYDEQYTEWLELRPGFIVAHFETNGELLGVGDCTILDIGKRALLRAPRVTRCGLVLPVISYQGYTAQPKDYLDYYDRMVEYLQGFRTAAIKKSLRG